MNSEPTVPARVPWFRRRPLVIIAAVLMLIIAGVGILYIVNPYALPNFHVFDKPSVAPRIEKAIRATFTGYCVASKQHMEISLVSFDRTGNTWDVICEPESAPWGGKFVEVNLSQCTIRQSTSSSSAWRDEYQWALDKQGNLPKLVVCP